MRTNTTGHSGPLFHAINDMLHMLNEWPYHPASASGHAPTGVWIMTGASV